MNPASTAYLARVESHAQHPVTSATVYELVEDEILSGTRGPLGNFKILLLTLMPAVHNLINQTVREKMLVECAGEWSRKFEAIESPETSIKQGNFSRTITLLRMLLSTVPQSTSVQVRRFARFPHPCSSASQSKWPPQKQLPLTAKKRRLRIFSVLHLKWCLIG